MYLFEFEAIECVEVNCRGKVEQREVRRTKYCGFTKYTPAKMSQGTCLAVAHVENYEELWVLGPDYGLGIHELIRYYKDEHEIEPCIHTFKPFTSHYEGENQVSTLGIQCHLARRPESRVFRLLR